MLELREQFAGKQRFLFDRGKQYETIRSVERYFALSMEIPNRLTPMFILDDYLSNLLLKHLLMFCVSFVEIFSRFILA